MDAMQAAVHLVTVEGMTVTAAAKGAGVPRMTLSDRLRKDAPTEDPKLGRPQELPAAVEEANVKCLITCAEFQYPMTRRDVQNIVQAYVLEKNVKPGGRMGCRAGTGWTTSASGGGTKLN
jgi:hypothetical protein